VTASAGLIVFVREYGTLTAFTVGFFKFVKKYP